MKYNVIHGSLGMKIYIFSHANIIFKTSEDQKHTYVSLLHFLFIKKLACYYSRNFL